MTSPGAIVARKSTGVARPLPRSGYATSIIYGPEYTAPEHLARLRARGLSAKRSLAIREFVLGLEALHRFVDREPLYRIDECVFGVLALESEPVDPRL
jgi:protein phosphatase